ncbi:MAG: MFS transporter [Rickettsia endosymbiont of Glossina mortisans submortisans]|nr:MFS transporter [Rickettsia endosymbiont of Glossina mortisans submortisans]
MYKKLYLIGILLLGLISGLTFNLIFFTVPYQLSEAKYTTDIIGSISLAAFPYCLKVIWSPFIDKYSIPFLCSKFGHRRGWALVSQIFLILAMTGFLNVSPCNNLYITAIILFIISFCSSTQDIVLDAYRIERPTSKEELSMAFTFSSIGFRLGMLLGSVGALYLSIIFGWNTVYKFALFITVVGPIVILCIKEPKPKEKRHTTTNLIGLQQYFEVIKKSIISLKNDACEMKNGYTKINLEKSKESISRGAERILIREHPRSYKGDVANFSSSSSILLIMLFVFLYKAADSIPMAMSSPLFLDLSFTTHEIAVIYKAYGLPIMIVGGALGGVLAAKMGIFHSVLIGGVIQLLSPLMFMILATIGYDIRIFIITVTVQNFCAGFAGTIISTYFASLCNSEFVATQYSIIASFSSLSRIILASLGGICAKYLTWSIFFLGNTLFSMLFIPIFYKIYRKKLDFVNISKKI